MGGDAYTGLKIIARIDLVCDLITSLQAKDVGNLNQPQMVVKMVLKNTLLLFLSNKYSYLSIIFGGGCEIRTHGTFPYACFQDRWIKPLSQPSPPPVFYSIFLFVEVI